jgi:hypothetical protein
MGILPDDGSEENKTADSTKNEINNLKNKISYYAGSLESVNYLLNKDDDSIEKNLEHIKYIVSRVIEDIRKES